MGTSRRLLLLAACVLAATVLLPASPSRGDRAAAALPAGIVFEGGRYLSKKDGMELVLVPAGNFVMGSDMGAFDERPAHSVRLGAYLIDKHEVTNAQFERFVTSAGYSPKGPWRRTARPRGHPVRFVTWHDAHAYATWAGRRLPTEAQWEKAARGEKQRVYPWGLTWQPGLARTDLSPSAGPTQVGSFPKGAGPYGCLDMAGNVWEWVGDWYDRYYYKQFRAGSLAQDPQGPPDGAPPERRFVESKTAAGKERSTRKVVRGGGWVRSGRENARTSKRAWSNPRYWSNDTGFRCALPLDE